MSTWGTSALKPASRPSWEEYLHQPSAPVKDALARARERAEARRRRKELLKTLLTLLTCLGLLFGTVYHGYLVAQAGKDLLSWQKALQAAEDERARLLAEVARMEGPSHVAKRATEHLEMVTSPRAYRAAVPTVPPREVGALPEGELTAVPLSPAENPRDVQILWSKVAAWIESWFETEAVGAQNPR